MVREGGEGGARGLRCGGVQWLTPAPRTLPERSHRAYNNARDVKGPVYITIGDGGNREGLATKWLSQTPISAFRQATYGHGEIVIVNSTVALWQWHEVRGWGVGVGLSWRAKLKGVGVWGLLLSLSASFTSFFPSVTAPFYLLQNPDAESQVSDPITIVKGHDVLEGWHM